jgi:hypothetical protein
MIEVKPRNKYSNSTPPNSEYQILSHPSGNQSKSIELALFNEHRFAFYYWLKWNLKNDIKVVPDLITFDWHQDLVYPCDTIKSELENLDLKNKFEISLFSWARLNSLNDDHILAATYLNQLNDIWVVCKQNHFSDWDDEEIIDYKGNKHTIRKFPNKDKLYEQLKISKISNLYLDIDLDFFTIENSTSNDKQKFTYMRKEEIENILSVESDFMRWLFQRMDGFTIALEPEHTGGISKSLKYLSLLNKILFKGEILHWHCKWKHLTNS